MVLSTGAEGVPFRFTDHLDIASDGMIYFSVFFQRRGPFPQRDFVLVNETYRYRIQRYWLKGPKAGTAGIFMDNLPGFPDNITSNRKGTFWLALFTVRNDRMDDIHPSPLLKKIVSRLPKFMWPKPKPYGIVLAINENGEIIRSLQDPIGEHLKEITGAREHDGYLYLGSLHNDCIGKYRLE